MKYATLEQMQKMELGVTGETRTINGVVFELMIDARGNFGWCSHGYDADGNLVQWDRVSEEEAKELGLIARQPTNYCEWQEQYTPDHRDEGSIAHFERYVSGDR